MSWYDFLTEVFINNCVMTLTVESWISWWFLRSMCLQLTRIFFITLNNLTCFNIYHSWYELYYDIIHYVARCREFYYGGCGGNENNFVSEFECENRCMEQIVTTTVAPTTQPTPAPGQQPRPDAGMTTSRVKIFQKHPYYNNMNPKEKVQISLFYWITKWYCYHLLPQIFILAKVSKIQHVANLKWCNNREV